MLLKYIMNSGIMLYNDSNFTTVWRKTVLIDLIISCKKSNKCKKKSDTVKTEVLLKLIMNCFYSLTLLQRTVFVYYLRLEYIFCFFLMLL